MKTTEEEKQFELIISETLNELQNLIIKKGKEYRRNNDPYHNFNRGAQFSGRTPEEVLQGFLLKHLISVDDIRNDLKNGNTPSIELVEEKYNDILVYFLIEKAMILSKL